jgi:hypothetical protein
MERRLLFMYCLLLAVFMVFNAGPVILHALEYRTIETQREEAPPASVPVPPTTSYTVDEAGHKDWIVTITEQFSISASLKVVRHIYLFGILADWLGVLDSIWQMKDIVNSIVTSSAIILFLSSKKLSTTITL